jgi:hypothetical protein
VWPYSVTHTFHTAHRSIYRDYGSRLRRDLFVETTRVRAGLPVLRGRCDVDGRGQRSVQASHAPSYVHNVSGAPVENVGGDEQLVDLVGRDGVQLAEHDGG